MAIPENPSLLFWEEASRRCFPGSGMRLPSAPWLPSLLHLSLSNGCSRNFQGYSRNFHGYSCNFHGYSLLCFPWLWCLEGKQWRGPVLPPATVIPDSGIPIQYSKGAWIPKVSPKVKIPLIPAHFSMSIFPGASSPSGNRIFPPNSAKFCWKCPRPGWIHLE